MVDLNKFESITKEHAAATTSGMYQFVPTMEVVEALGKNGWVPAKAMEKNSKPFKRVTQNGQVIEVPNPRFGFQKHLIRFRNEDVPAININDDMTYPEIVLSNSHDGSASFQVMAGLFRLVCLNGLVVADSMLATYRIMHLGYTREAVTQAVEHVMEGLPRIANRLGDFQIPLTPDEQVAYAESALAIKYGDDEAQLAKYDPSALVRPARRQDEDGTLWKTYNTVQEKLVEKGGTFKRNDRNAWRLKKARGTTNIEENLRINKGLWMLTEKMAELKA